MTAVWRCAQCGREQGEDIEQPCACGSTVWVSSSTWKAPDPLAAYTIGADPAVPCDGDGFLRWERTETGWNLFRSAGDGSWVFDRHIDRDEEPEQPTALDYCPKPNTP